jgi:peptidoglycan/LPS O-acetylase OafA/YrhL
MALWSYSLYLSNLLVYNLVQTFWLAEARKTVMTVTFASSIFIGGSIISSAVVYRYFEVPLLKLRERTSRRHPKEWSLKQA